MRILLVIPPSEFLIDDRAFPFLGPLQIAAVARDAGHEVRVCDLTGHARRCSNQRHEDCLLRLSCDELLAAGAGFSPNLIGFYALYAHFPIVSKLLGFLRCCQEYDGARIVIGGPHANTSPEECIAAGFDFAVVADQGGGGGEAGFLRLLAELAPEEKRSGLRTAPEPIVKVPSRPDGAGADRGGETGYFNDRWPYPARDLIDLESYRYVVDGRRFTTAVSQAGCPFNCHFCGHWSEADGTGGYTKLVLRSPAHVRGEIEQIVENYPWARGIMFYDDEVNIRPDFGDFLAMLSECREKFDLRFRGFFKSGKSFMRAEIFASMAKAGFIELCTGVEAADPHLLRMVGKGATVEDNTRFVELCAENGIAMKLFSMVGHPDETWETVRRLRDWLCEMVRRTDNRARINADVTILTPTRHTPIWDKPEKFANLKFDRSIDFGRELVHYKGKPGEYKAFTTTLGLSAAQLIEARQWVEDEFRAAAGLPPLMAAGKDDG